uniref:Uncharacterized protein n=1 Tax=Arundo donax TaxID=35708 RepID=A0A0A9A2M3_ARUDO
MIFYPTMNCCYSVANLMLVPTYKLPSLVSGVGEFSICFFCCLYLN